MSTASQTPLISRMPRQQIPLPELIAPIGSKPVGTFDDGGEAKIVYELNVLDVDAMIAGKKPLLDEDGNPVVRNKGKDEHEYPVWRLPREPIFRKKRFILRRFQSGKVSMVENFEETAAERDERVRRQRVAAVTEDLAQEVVNRGFENAADMLDHLFSGLEVEPGSELEQMATEADSEPKAGQKSPKKAGKKGGTK